MRIGIVVNPRARGACDPRLPARLRALAERAGVACQVAVTQDPADLPQVMAGLAAFGVDVLGVCGGDGTLMTTLSALGAAAAELPLLLLPAGTMNTVAKNLGLPPRPEALLQATLAAAAGRGLPAVPFWPQETLRVRTYGETPHRPDDTWVVQRDAAGEGPAATAGGPAAEAPAEAPAEAKILALPRRERCGFLFSGAMGARFLSAYNSVAQPGLRWAVILALRTIASCLYPGGGTLARWLFQPTAMRILVDGAASAASASAAPDAPVSTDAADAISSPATPPLTQISGSFRLLLAATVSDAGLGMRVPWRAGRVPGRFQLIASALSAMDNALQLPRIVRAQPLRGTPHHDFMARAARLRFDAPQPLVFDGELFSAAAVDIELGPTLSVLRPTMLRARARLW